MEPTAASVPLAVPSALRLGGGSSRTLGNVVENVKRYLIALVLISSPTRSPGEPERAYKDIPPIVDADTTQQEERVVAIPTRFLVRRMHVGLVIEDDPASRLLVRLVVGRNMVVGCRSETYYFNGTERVRVATSGPFGGDIGVPVGLVLPVAVETLASRRGAVQVIVELTVFETDVPCQHLWLPQRGRFFKELWKSVAVGEIASE